MRNIDGTFRPGYSGNPGGRPAVVSELQKLARAQTPAALAALIEVLSDAGNPPSARVAAAVALLDRGYGRPSNAVVIETAEAAYANDDERAELLERLIKGTPEAVKRAEAAEKRADEAERRVAELESAGGSA
jgi:hypothetical protein